MNEVVFILRIPETEALLWLLTAADFKLHRPAGNATREECLFTPTTIKLFVNACIEVDLDVLYNDYNDEETPKRIVWLVNFIATLENHITCIDANYKRHIPVTGYERN